MTVETNVQNDAEKDENEMVAPVTRVQWSFEDWRRGKVYYTSDWHLGHERINELAERPFTSVGEMNDAILDGVNSRVSRSDTLVVLGDLALGKLEETLKLLAQVRAGRIWLIPGNHDRWSLAYGHRGAVETQRVKRALWRTQYERSRHGVRAEPDLVPSAWSVRVGGRRVLISHYPYAGDSRVGEGVTDRHRALRPRDQGLPLLNGHVHQRWKIGRAPDGQARMLNVGVDVWEYAPVSEDTVADWLASVNTMQPVISDATARV